MMAFLPVLAFEGGTRRNIPKFENVGASDCSPTCPVLEALGKKQSFEIAVGLNGRVWVNASSPHTVILVANAIMNSETLSGTQQRIMVEKLLERIQ
ncbi:hypothetical protein ACLOJK_032472 [Asimina triloba]